MKVRTICSLILPLLIFACSTEPIELDFRKLEFLDLSGVESQNSDSLIIQYTNYNELAKSEGLEFYTDKEEYKIGEVVTLTIENNSADQTEYYFPNKHESAKRKALFEMYPISDEDLRLEIESVLISESPAFVGQLWSINTDFFALSIEALDQYSAERLDYEAYEKPLEPGDKLNYTVQLPQRPGYYIFMLNRHTKNEDGIGIWGINRFQYSNVIQLVE